VVVDLLDVGICMTVAAGAQRETLQVVLAALGVGDARARVAWPIYTAARAIVAATKPPIHGV
jgi:hypothetical protein